MSTAGSFDGAPERGTINFSVGQPSADLLPLKLLASGSERFFADAAPFDLNYGQRQGDPRFRAALADFLAKAYGAPVDPDSLMLTGGISQGLDFVCGRLAKAGDVIFVEEPSYPYSFPIFRDHGLEIVGVPVDAGGMDLAQLERLLAQHRPTLVYTIPSFHNPTGRVLDRARRDRLIALSREHGFTILADEVYQLLYHGAPPPPSFGVLGTAGNVLSLGTFSKILAPGLRLGWIQTTPALMQRLLASGALVSGGNFNHFTSHLVRWLMESGELAAFVETLRARYAERAQAMDAASRAGRSRAAAISSGSSCRKARIPRPSRRRRVQRAPASCPAASARTPAANGTACACRSRIIQSRISTRASRGCARPLSSERDHRAHRHPRGRDEARGDASREAAAARGRAGRGDPEGRAEPRARGFPARPRQRAHRTRRRGDRGVAQDREAAAGPPRGLAAAGRPPGGHWRLRGRGRRLPAARQGVDGKPGTPAGSGRNGEEGLGARRGAAQGAAHEGAD
jgi:2-aminoadipate transaminase